MTDTDTFSAKTSGPHGVTDRKIAATYGSPASLTLLGTGSEGISLSARDLFECMKLLRKHLEVEGTVLLCNGARVDAYPSQMARQMGAARRVHITTLGKQTTREDLVDIFGEAPIEKIGSVEAQYAFHQEWLRTLGWEV